MGKIFECPGQWSKTCTLRNFSDNVGGLTMIRMAWSRHMRQYKRRDATPVLRRPVANRGVYALCACMSVITIMHTTGQTA